jgi:serine/threonine protein kinase
MGAADDITILNPDLILREGYRIVRLIGRGGMGCVYEALRLPPFNEIVALKQTVYAAGDERQQWFQLEAEKLHKLRAYPKTIRR